MNTNEFKDKILEIAEDDLNKILKHKKHDKPVRNSIFDDFDKNFKSKLKDNRAHLQNIRNSISNTRK